jgi:Pyridine nucleotide-disulphide oxidoreductase, dimerisation domain
LRTNLLEHASANTQDRLVPYTIFIDPQLGRVGLSENEARKQERNIRVAKLPMNAVIRALETGETRGFMKAIVDTETNHILGWPPTTWRNVRWQVFELWTWRVLNYRPSPALPTEGNMTVDAPRNTTMAQCKSRGSVKKDTMAPSRYSISAASQTLKCRRGR